MLSLYVDTADVAEATRLMRTGIFRGVTTNPLLLGRAGLGAGDLPALVEGLVAAGAEEVFCQAWGETAEDLVSRGTRLRGLDPRVVVKVPATRAGTTAAAELARQGVPVLLTAVYAASQAVVAAAAGCSYLAPYLGRMGDAGMSAHREVTSMHHIVSRLGTGTRVLVASVRAPSDVAALAQEGVGCFALAPSVADALFDEPLTVRAAAEFEEAAATAR